MMMMILQFNGTSTPKGSHSAKTDVNCPMSLNRVHYKRMLWSNECKVQRKMSSHLLKKSIHGTKMTKCYPWFGALDCAINDFATGICCFLAGCTIKKPMFAVQSAWLYFALGQVLIYNI